MSKEEKLELATEEEFERKKCSTAVMAVLEEYGYDLAISGFTLIPKVK